MLTNWNSNKNSKQRNEKKRNKMMRAVNRKKDIGANQKSSQRPKLELFQQQNKVTLKYYPNYKINTLHLY